MFYVPKDAIFKTVSRRKFLELGGRRRNGTWCRLACCWAQFNDYAPAYAASSDDAKWKQYAGSKLVFMSENTPPSSPFATPSQSFMTLLVLRSR